MKARTSALRAAALAALALAGACAPEHETRVDASAVAAVTPKWTHSDLGAFGAQVALDPDGNVLAAGSFPYITIGLSKFDPAGTLLWQSVFDNPNTREQASWLALDAAGNAYVSGYLVYTSSQDPGGFVLVKFAPAGGILWSDVIPMTLGQAVRVGTDAAGNAYVTGKGWTAGSADVDFVTMKYAPDGTRLWLRTHGVAGSADEAAALAVSADGTVAVAGSPRSGSPMMAVVYDADGNVRWSTSGEPGRARDVAFGPNGELYVAGGTYELRVVKYDTAGRLLWSRSAPGFSAERLALDAAGNAFVTGTAVQTSGMPYTDWMTAKFESTGRVAWTQRYDAHDANDEAARSLAVTPEGGVVVAGSGGPGPTSGVLSYLELVVLEYGADGTPAWSYTTFDAIDGVALRVAGPAVYGVARSPMTAFRIDRPGAAPPPPAEPPPPPPTDPVPPPPDPAPVVTPTMSVADIAFTVRTSGAKVKVMARVQVRDAAGAAVPGATVTARWTTPARATTTVIGTTDAAGVAQFAATGRAGTYTLSIDGVVKAGFVFDAAAGVLTRSVTVPGA